MLLILSLTIHSPIKVQLIDAVQVSDTTMLNRITNVGCQKKSLR